MNLVIAEGGGGARRSSSFRDDVVRLVSGGNFFIADLILSVFHFYSGSDILIFKITITFVYISFLFSLFLTQLFPLSRLAGIAGCVAKSATAPFDRVKILYQVIIAFMHIILIYLILLFLLIRSFF